MDLSVAAVLTTDVRRLKDKATSLAKANSMRRLLLCGKLYSLVNVLWTVQWACGEAEKQPEGKPAVENWLKQLREEILRADDLLDMIKLRRLPRKRRTSAAAHVGRDFILAIPVVLHFAAGCRLKRSVRAFNDIARTAKSFSNDEHSTLENARPALLPATCYMKDEDKVNLANMIKHGEKLAVVTIVGTAGSGKSTLARFVYHDQKRNFDARMLVDRSSSTGEAQRMVMFGRTLPLSELRTARNMVEEAEQEQAEQPLEFSLANREGRPSLRRSEMDRTTQFDTAIEVIEKSLDARRFLLVLLDVNHVAQPALFEKLMEALEQAARPGSTVILTTTNPDVASAVTKPSRTSCSLNSDSSRLTRQDSWKLFKEHASLHHLPDEHYFWQPRIIDECGGHPLSVIMMAKKMRRKPALELLQPTIDLSHPNQHQKPQLGRQDIPRLSAELKQMYERLIYDVGVTGLPSEKLRNCFTFLSLFPEDHRFCMEELVDLWAAHNSISMDEAANYFEAFTREGAFVPCGETAYVYSTHRKAAYRMRDLLPYFAQHIGSSNVHLALSPHSFDLLQLDPSDVPICQHLSFVCDPESSGFPVDMLFEGSPWLLRTLLLLGPPSDDKCLVRDAAIGRSSRKFKYLRVLHVRGITFGILLDVIGRHSNLTYLNVSQSDVNTLPESISEFVNLKILKLSFCRNLRRLPKSITRLLHLEKLDLEGCSLLASWPLNWLVKLFRLEHLNLSRIDYESLPQSLGNLRNLRALILAHCRKIQRLPESTTKLLNLERLDLEGCHFLEELPERGPEQSLSLMKNLKLLNTLHCFSLTRMPPGLGNLSNLQLLTRYVESQEAGRSISELQTLTNLEGELWLDKLERLTNPEVAALAKLEEKEKLRSLTLRWDFPIESEALQSDEQSPETPEKVLEALCPSKKLRSIKLILYTAKMLPSWMIAESPYLTSLVDIRLFNLKRCERLPPLGELVLLKVIEMSGMDAVIELDRSFYGQTGRFPSLEKLTLSHMPKLIKWHMPDKHHVGRLRDDTFPKLGELTFMNCPKLEPPNRPLPSVTAMTMWMNNEMLFSAGSGLQAMAPRVGKLSISLCPAMRAASPEFEGLWGLTSLEELNISACDSLTRLPEGMMRLTSLRTLQILRCGGLKCLPEWMNELASLRWLFLSACVKLRPRPRAPRRSHGRHGLRVSAEGCPLLKYP